MNTQSSTNECYVYFALDGDDFDPDDLTQLIGIAPSKIRRKRDMVSNNLPKFNSWQIHSEKVIDEFVDVYDLSEAVVLRLKDRVELILESKKKYNLTCRLQVVLWVTSDESQSTPAIGFEENIINFLAKVGASVDVDTYRT
jgi:hypothetical protein